MATSLSTFLDLMDRHPERVPLDELTTLLRDLEIGIGDVEHVMEFSDSTYRRNLLHRGPGYQALVLCWKPGQRSPIHDHAGSSCGVVVLRGTMTETVFKRGASGMLMAVRSHELAAGGVCGSQDADIHQVSNLSKIEPLVTLHIYSPALDRMGTYSLTEAKVTVLEDPVYEFAQGAGI
jgi:cysteine dioxygenase